MNEGDQREVLLSLYFAQLRGLLGPSWTENDEVLYSRSVESFDNETIARLIEELLNKAERRPAPAVCKGYCMEILSPTNFPTVDQVIAEINEYRRNPPTKRIRNSWGGTQYVNTIPNWSHDLIGEIIESLGGWPTVYDQTKNARDISFAVGREYKRVTTKKKEDRMNSVAMITGNTQKLIGG